MTTKLQEAFIFLQKEKQEQQFRTSWWNIWDMSEDFGIFHIGYKIISDCYRNGSWSGLEWRFLSKQRPILLKWNLIVVLKSWKKI